MTFELGIEAESSRADVKVRDREAFLPAPFFSTVVDFELDSLERNKKNIPITTKINIKPSIINSSVERK